MKDTPQDKKSKILGMPWGTANHRLRKSILFSLLQRLGEDCCFRCGNKVVDIDTLSIEHKQPWVDDPDLFWDLGNISFSHLKCNIQESSLRNVERSRENVEVARKAARAVHSKPPVGDTAWCGVHQLYVDREEFGKNATTVSGLRWECNQCRKKARRNRGRVTQ